jgi:phosphatidylserine/phosphatidylglycerophosphate/cardiolipin synthase-like enzyme
MATFVPFAPDTGVQRLAPDITGVQPDPVRNPGEPISRPGVARHAGATVVWLPLVAQGGPTFPLRAPAGGTCRLLPLTTPLPELPGVATIVELSPLPFAGAGVFRRLPGLPTFYLAPVTTDPLPAEDDFIPAGSDLAAVSSAFVGLLFDDRLALSPASWIEQIALAMTGLDTAAEVVAWRLLDRFTPTGRSIRVLDHVGRPMVGAQIRVAGPTGTSSVLTDASASLALPAGDVQLTWQAVRPVHALYELGLATPEDRTTSTRPGGTISVPAALSTGHLQVFDTARWFADRPPQLDPGLGEVHSDSRLEPLVDGLESFRMMLADLRAATTTGPDAGGAHFAGWAFNDFPLDLADPERTMFTKLVRDLRGGEGTRFLMDRYLVFRPDAPTDAINRFIVVLLTAGVDVLIVLSVLDKLDIDDRGYLALAGLGLIGGLVASQVGIDPLLDTVEDAIDGSEELAEALNAIVSGIALRARHPARFVDNALVVVNPLPVDPSDFVEGVGSWHQKFQVVRRTPDSLGNRVIGYLGGIDINRNRLDSPGHHGRVYRPPDQVSNTPSAQKFHDVHARITGPAAADVALTFERRWAFDSGRQPAGTPQQPGLAFATPVATDTTEVPPQPARHLVQVGRTGYAPNPAGGSTPLPWSQAGEAIIPQAIAKAFEGAREYIYIEDQYFTPDDAYIRALLDASVREPKLRLLIVMPTSSDQLFGDNRRREMFERLRDDPATGRGWGDRMIVGAPVRRPVLGDAGRVASKGRLVLQGPLDSGGGETQVALGPRSRLPSDVPFWMWVEGERILAVERRDDVVVDAVPARNYLVRRSGGAEPLWGARPRAHAKGAPVTLAQVTGIYVHTKAVMVDDVFVGIGSCNMNRRGFFHDGEITAFAVPEQLKASRENPALNLRTALWAEHLGIPPAMGRALLADPVAAFELFRRSTFNGNRLSTFDALGITPELGFPSEGATWVKLLATLGLVIADDLVPYVWNVFVDPTTATDPDPAVGPGLGAV